MPRAFTLLEVMVAIAMVGIIVALAMIAPMAPASEASDALVRERALQWLEYEAEAISRGIDPDAQVVERLRALVPSGAATTSIEAGGLARVEVRYRRPDGRDGAVALLVFRGGR